MRALSTSMATRRALPVSVDEDRRNIDLEALVNALKVIADHHIPFDVRRYQGLAEQITNLLFHPRAGKICLLAALT